MAATQAVVQKSKIQGLRANVVTVTMDNSYPTNGEAVTANGFGLQSISLLILEPNSGYVPEYVASSGKVVVRWVDTTTDGAALAEVANTTDLSAVVFRGLAIGI